MSGSVKDIDKGYSRLLKTIVSGKNASLKVGIFGAKAQETEPNGKTLLEIATINEFGAGHVPERSFIRGYCDEHGAEVVAHVKADCERAVKMRIPFEVVLERLGLFVVGGIQKRISEGIAPPNAASTVAKKGSSTPLIDTGKLRAAIAYQVVRPGSGDADT